MSNAVGLPDLYFHWPQKVVASFVLGTRDIVCAESSRFVRQSQIMSGELLTFLNL